MSTEPNPQSSAAVVYLYESGDLGWKFDAPYRRGGSSRFLTIAAVVVPRSDRPKPKRVIKRLYQKFNWNTSNEKKWAQMSGVERLEFASQARGLQARLPAIRYLAIVVQKINVAAHIRADENKLYNYMIKLLLAKEMAKFDEVTFVPDERSVKVRSGNSLHDYLQTTLWFELDVSTKLSTRASSSAATTNLQFADMLAGVVQSKFEDNASSPYSKFAGNLHVKRLFHR